MSVSRMEAMMTVVNNECISRWMVLAILIAFITLTGCTKNRDDHDHPHLVTGEELFNHHCSECHGQDGTGKLAAQTPANILTYRGRAGIIDYIIQPINPNRAMPVFANMPRSEAALIADHLLELKNEYDKQPLNKKKSEDLMIRP